MLRYYEITTYLYRQICGKPGMAVALNNSRINTRAKTPGREMKKIVATLFVFCFLAVSTQAAAPWTMYDFGDNVFDHNNNWSPINYGPRIGNLPSPGNLAEGGEGFDLEGFHFAQDGSNINLAVVNSFGYTAHSTGWNQDYNLGDLFFGFDGDCYQYGIDVSTGELYKVDSYVGIPNMPGTYYGTDIATAAGAWEITGGQVLGNVNWAMNGHQGFETNPMNGSGDTYIWEFSFDAGLISDFDNYSSICFSQTLGCGNDKIYETYPGVPEPITLVLMGAGLLGMGTYRKLRNRV